MCIKIFNTKDYLIYIYEKMRDCNNKITNELITINEINIFNYITVLIRNCINL